MPDRLARNECRPGKIVFPGHPGNPLVDERQGNSNEKTIIWKHESLLWKHDTLYGHHVHHRGAAGVRADRTRDEHASILSCATVTRARARWSRA
jgi:hypothetical protein